MLQQKTILSNFKNTEIIPSIFSDHNGMKLEISKKELQKKKKLKNIHLKIQGIKEEIIVEIKYPETNDNCECSKSDSKREVHSNKHPR